MSEPTYTLTLTESERIALAAALGTFVTKLTTCRVQIEAPTGGTHAARALLSPSTAPPAAAPAASPIEQRDRWARDRKGNELPNPEGCNSADVHIWKTEQKEKYLKVTFQTNGYGYVDANCFDQQLWPWLITCAAESSKPTRLYLLRKDKYLNIVGVRA
jgi:hypothetical protein